MDRPFGKKSKKSLRLSKHIVLGIPANIAAGPLGFRAELDIGPKGEESRPHRDSGADQQADPTWTLDEKDPWTSRIVFCERGGDGQGAPVQEASTSGAAIGGGEQGNSLTSECHRSPPSRPMLTQISVSLVRNESRRHRRGKWTTDDVCRCVQALVGRSSLLTPPSSGEGPQGHYAFNYCHSH